MVNYAELQQTKYYCYVPILEMFCDENSFN